MSFDEGWEGSGGAIIARTLRPTCTGVQIKPHGNPHQPSSPVNTRLPSCDFTPQRRHFNCGWDPQRVSASADQYQYVISPRTRYDLHDLSVAESYQERAINPRASTAVTLS